MKSRKKISCKLHPQEKTLRRKAEQLGFIEEEAEFLLELMGWKNHDGSIPQITRGLEPFATLGIQSVVREMTEKTENLLSHTFSQIIRLLLKRIMGLQLIKEVQQKKNQPKQLCIELQLERIQVMWLLMQLKFIDNESISCFNPDPDIHDLCVMAPELIYRRAVLETIGALLEKREN